MKSTGMFHSHLRLALQLASDAGGMLLAEFRPRTKISVKSDGTPVTNVDFRVEHYLRERIRSQHPTHSFLGEETGCDGLPGSEYKWVVDPLDGTRWYAHGIPYFGILIALEVAGVPHVGVCHFPALGETLWAATGGGAYLNGHRVRVRRTTNLSKAVVSLADLGSFQRRGRLRHMWRIHNASLSSCSFPDAYGHALVASGRLDLMLDPIASVWDCAPFVPILREAGGYFGDWSGTYTIHGGEALSTSLRLLPEVVSILTADHCPKMGAHDVPLHPVSSLR